MKTIGIYCLLNTANGKRYVGQSNNVSRRQTVHFSELRRGIHANEHLQRAWSKYGGDAFEWQMLEEVPENMLDVREVAWIGYYQSNNPDYGYNHDSGGHVNRCLSAESRLRMSEAKKNISEETRRKMSEAKKGKRPCNFGSYHSLETRRKMSETKMGKPSGRLGCHLSEAHRRKLSESHKNSTACVENCRRMAAVQRGKPGKSLGMHHSDETRRKISKSKKLLSEESHRRLSESHKGKHPSEETRRKVSEALRGIHRSDETRRKMSEAKRTYWMKRHAK